jgi:hypothetical protein
MVAAAAAEGEFLAFRKGLEPEVRGEFPSLAPNGPIHRYESLVAERLVLNAGLARPRSWAGASRDLQALDLPRGGPLEMASTHLVGDSLGVGAADPDGWSVFYVASYEQRAGYVPFYSEAADYKRTGKRAPKLVDYLNWNQDAGSEMLVHVFGAKEDWYEAVAQRGGRWARVWEGPRCRE